MTYPTTTDKRDLDFEGVLAELQDFIGRSIVIESVGRDGRTFHQSEGVLERTIDNHVDLLSSPDRQAVIAFHLDAHACFILHKCEFAAASTRVIGDHDEGLTCRMVKIETAGDTTLIIRDAWEREWLDQRTYEQLEGLE